MNNVRKISTQRSNVISHTHPTFFSNGKYAFKLMNIVENLQRISRNDILINQKLMSCTIKNQLSQHI